MDATKLVKNLWIKFDGDSSRIFEAIKKKTDLPSSDEEVKEAELRIAKFDSEYDSLTIIDEKYQEKFQPRWNEFAFGRQPPFLIRWNRTATSVVTRHIMDEFDHNIFILDRNVKKYNISEKVNGFGYIYDNDTETYQIYHIHLSEPVLVTKSFEEVRNFAVVSCKFLLVGNKCDESNEAFKNQMLNTYLIGGNDCRVMAVPGRSGCFANKCLKTIPEVMFIDCWDDVDNIVHQKEEK